MTDSIKAAQIPSHYSLEGNLYNSTGNPYAHGILRGGMSGPNYSADHIRQYLKEKTSIKNPAIIIDCNHGNSLKDPFKQISIIESMYHDILPSLDTDDYSARDIVKGFMVESYLYDGRQDVSENIIHGLSLTDACIGKEKTLELIMRLYHLIGENKS